MNFDALRLLPLIVESKGWCSPSIHPDSADKPVFGSVLCIVMLRLHSQLPIGLLADILRSINDQAPFSTGSLSEWMEGMMQLRFGRSKSKDVNGRIHMAWWFGSYIC